MNGNKTATIVVSIIVVLLVLGGIFYLATRNVPVTNNSPITPSTTSAPEGTAKQPGSPIVATKSVSFVYQSTAVLNGDINPNGVQTSYWYEYGETNSFGNSSAPQLIGGGYVMYSAPGTIVGLKANTLYYYRLAAQNQYGQVFGSTLNFKTTNALPPPYFSPSVQTKDASGITSDSVNLNGNVNPHNADTSYWFEYGKGFGLGNTTSTISAGSGNANIAISASLSGLEPNTTYYYRLNAQNAFGTVNGNISVFNTQPTNPPTPPLGNAPVSVTSAAGSIAATSAVLNGQINPNGAATTYHFEYGKSSLFGLFTLDQRTIESSAGSGTKLATFSRSITGLDNGSTYYYQIVSVNTYGTTRGAIYSFTTKKK